MTGRRSALAGLLLLGAVPTRADTLIDHVAGVTADGHGGIESFTGLIIGEDGRVVTLLHAGERRPRTSFATDAKGLGMIPGLVLGNVRLMRLGLTLLASGRPLASLPPPRPEDRDRALAEAQQALLAHGITSVADMGETIEDWQALRRAGDAGRLVIRVTAYADGVAQMALIGGPGPGPWLYDGRLKAQGVWLDGDGAAASPAGMIALKNNISRAAIDHFQVVLRPGRIASADLAAALADLGQTYTGDRRWVIQAAPPTEVAPDLLGDLGGTDGGPLITHTAAPAHDLFADGEEGCLRPQCRADFLLLDRSPLATVNGQGEARIAQVWVGGRLVLDLGKAAGLVPAAPDRPADPRGTRGGEGR